MVNQELLAACKAALECIAQLTPFPSPNAPKEVQHALEQAAGHADKVRSQLREAIAKAENNKQPNALLLLKRLIEENDPFINDDYGNTYCFFCSEDKPDHSADCIYIEALQLLGITEPKGETESWYNEARRLLGIAK